MYEYYLYAMQANYGGQPSFYKKDKIPSTGFRSLYSVTKQDAEAIKAGGTCKWFKGTVWNERLCLDFDSFDAAERAESRLRALKLDFKAYHTGGRGGHFELSRITAPSHLLPQMDKQWAKEHFPECDSSIYTHLHPYRLEGTIHEKTGAKKELVASSEGSSVTLSPLKEWANVPESRRGDNSSRRKSIFDCWRVLANTVPVRNGSRHETLVKLVYALRDAAGINAPEALWWVSETNKLFEEPKSNEELEYIIKSIYGGSL